jgi:hypothetical protein
MKIGAACGQPSALGLYGFSTAHGLGTKSAESLYCRRLWTLQ